jgi:hypothetical protein
LGTILATGGDRARIYRNQMFWKNPSDDTVITMCSYHAPKGKVTVLYLSGVAKVYDVQKLKSELPGYEAVWPTPAGRDFDFFKLRP